MAIADFFDKSALAASQVLAGFDLNTFRHRLNETLVAVAFDSNATSAEGAITLELTTNLLARLFPRIAFVPLDETAKSVLKDLKGLAISINPKIDFFADQRSATFAVCVGLTRPDIEAELVHIGSEGWIAKLSKDKPVGSGASANPFGASAAACFGAANAFRSIFGSQLPDGHLDRDIRLSLLNYEIGARAQDHALPKQIDLGELHLAGVGAIGNATVWTLARLPNATATLHAVDPEKLDLGNLQRYVLGTRRNVNSWKVGIAKAHLTRHPAIKLVAHRQSWSEYLAKRKNWALERVAVTLDTADARIEVQSSLPRWLVNAWTQPSNLGVSRHSFLGDKACLACLLWPEGTARNESELIAEEIGLPQAEREVRDLLALNKPLSREFLSRVASAKGILQADLSRFEGESLSAFHNKAVCGGILLRMGATQSHASLVEAPMAFQSALAGIMLASELVINALAPEEVRPTRTEVNLLAPLTASLSQEDKKHPSGRCICQDSDYIAAYNAKWGRTPSP